MLDLLQLRFALGDAAAALFQHLLDRAEGELLEHEDHQEEIDHLCDEERRAEAESRLDGFKRTRLIGSGEDGRHHGRVEIGNWRRSAARTLSDARGKNGIRIR